MDPDEHIIGAQGLDGVLDFHFFLVQIEIILFLGSVADVRARNGAEYLAAFADLESRHSAAIEREGRVAAKVQLLASRPAKSVAAGVDAAAIDQYLAQSAGEIGLTLDRNEARGQGQATIAIATAKAPVAKKAKLPLPAAVPKKTRAAAKAKLPKMLRKADKRLLAPLAPAIAGAEAAILDRLWQVVEDRRQSGDTMVSHSARLLARGTAKVAQKLGEEAVECVIEATLGNRKATVERPPIVLA